MLKTLWRSATAYCRPFVDDERNYTDYRRLECALPDGEEYKGWVREAPMPRLSDQILDCVVYINRSRQAARRGEDAGGSAFLVEVMGEKRPFFYVVTDYHVIRDEYENHKASAIRLTSTTTEPDRSQVGILRVTYTPKVASMPADHWSADKEKDLAGASIDLSPDIGSFKVIPTTMFANFEIIGRRLIGVGEEVFMIGRLVTLRVPILNDIGPSG
jgi:hypothetical protein